MRIKPTVKERKEYLRIQCAIKFILDILEAGCSLEEYQSNYSLKLDELLERRDKYL